MAVQKNLAAITFTNTEARLTIVVRRAARDVAATPALDPVEQVEDTLQRRRSIYIPIDHATQDCEPLE